jgi:hypothetical protein
VKFVFLVVVVCVAGFFGYPLLAESTAGSCDSLERLAIRVAVPPGQGHAEGLAIGQVLQSVFKGGLASAVAADQYPRVPPGVACTILYWKTLVDPGSIRAGPLKLR